ncbi:MAG: PIG-L family deacetylase, partial [Luteibacter sp.]
MSRDPVIDGGTRLLVVAPHPDDESLAAGMLIQRTLAMGGRADVLLLTDGDDNPWPQRWLERRLVIDASGRARWGARRRLEVASALGRLGVPPDQLHALGWHDMQVTDALRFRHAAAVTAVRRVIERVRPTLAVIPDLGDSHPDHGSAHVLARLALSAAGSMADVLTYMVHGTERSAPEDLLVPDEDPGRQATKVSAVLEHATQMALSRKRMLGVASRPERFDRPAAAPG